jgi:deoxyadenosine/deoxycytidine kinase
LKECLKQSPDLPDNHYIVVEGNIGSGKTSLARMLAHRYNTGLILESFDENTFLHRFYADPVRYAFPLEMSFLADRYNQIRQALPASGGQAVVSDYFFEKCLLFARVNLLGEEFRLLESFFTALEPQVPKPDLIIFLKSDVERLRQNISRRGRWFEESIQPAYLAKLNEAYEKRLRQMSESRIVEVDASRLDFVNNPEDYMKIINMITVT